MQPNTIVHGDCLEVIRQWPDECVDLVFGSPPYEDARIKSGNLRGQDWVDWMVDVVIESLRVCKGLVAFVVEGRTRKFSWSATPALLMADLVRLRMCKQCGNKCIPSGLRSGETIKCECGAKLKQYVHLRNPVAYHRSGICGSGGPDWFRNDWEPIICCTKGGKLPWSDNTACGGPPKYGPGGVMSHRLSSGERITEAKMRKLVEQGLSQREAARIVKLPFKQTTSGIVNGHTNTVSTYVPPKRTNPGNVFHTAVGGGKMGSWLAHENTAPFHENIARPFVLSFCPPDGIVLDPFSGSATTLAVALMHGRRWVGIEKDREQVDLGWRRIEEAKERVVAEI